MEKPKSVLIIGAGSNNIQHGGEVDSATYQVATYLHRDGLETILADNNPFSYSLKDSSVIDYSSIGPLTVDHLLELIKKYQPEAILPTLGSRHAFFLTQELLEKGVMRENDIRLLGLPEATIRQINNPVLLERTLRRMNAPMKKIATVNNYPEAMQTANEIGYPVVVRSVLPKVNSTRQIVHERAELSAAVQKCLNQSRAEQVFVQQSLAGYKEIEVVVQRDSSGTMMMLGITEDMDPIGIHAGDSIAFTPALTLLDRQIQDMRDTAFAITRKLRVVGVNHIQFALNPITSQYYVIKVSPYFDRMVSFIEQATGYPVTKVAAQLYRGKLLREIDLGDQYTKHAAIIEPAMDHIAVSIPVWGESEEKVGKQELGTKKKSVGSVFGIGRSPVEALFKALGSRYQMPTNTQIDVQSRLSDDEIVNRLIHPHAGRIFTLLEAMRRGYTIHELTEITKIDPFYFDQLGQMKDVLNDLVKSPGKEPVLIKAKHMGISNQLIAHLWQMSPKMVYQMTQDHNLSFKYKEIEPSAGEFDQHTQTFYSAMEDENEAKTLSQPSVLFVGTGGLRLGLSNSADFFIASMMRELHTQGYNTIIMNSDPSSVTMNTLMADKRYIEPVTPENLLSIVEIDQPQLIFIPASYSNILQTLKDYNLQSKVISLPDDRLHELPQKKNPLIALNYLCYGRGIRLLNTTAGLAKKGSTAYDMVDLTLPASISDNDLAKLHQEAVEIINGQGKPGFYQVIFEDRDDSYEALMVQPIPLPEIAFMSKALEINLPALLVRSLFDEEFDLNATNIQTPKKNVTYHSAFPLSLLHSNPEAITSSSQMIGAEMEFGDEIK